MLYGLSANAQPLIVNGGNSTVFNVTFQGFPTSVNHIKPTVISTGTLSAGIYLLELRFSDGTMKNEKIIRQ